MKEIRGVVLYDGPSRVNGKPIIVVATFVTTNRKTGHVVQTWILYRDESPIEAINTGADVAVCGACPLRGYIENGVNRGRACYVRIDRAPRAVWEAFHNGSYPTYDAKLHAKLFKRRGLRLGSYGEPVAVPLAVWRPIFKLARGVVGYTHLWRVKRFAAWSKYVLASVHTNREFDQAHGQGWQTYRTREANQPLRRGEKVCGASDEAGNVESCASCMKCDGQSGSHVIIGHGGSGILARLTELHEG